ncbi:MAG: hypothetical protein H7Z14_09495 [Anaerolineae bacterium]|nr:hypothetical protein [Phycisphaerae bacterium]
MKTDAAREVGSRRRTLHITLKLRGEIAEDRVEEIRDPRSAVAVQPMNPHADRFERFSPRGPALHRSTTRWKHTSDVAKLFFTGQPYSCRI